MIKARNGIAIEITVALLMLTSSIITVVFEKETNYTLTNMIYDTNNSKCIKSSEITLK